MLCIFLVSTMQIYYMTQLYQPVKVHYTVTFQMLHYIVIFEKVTSYGNFILFQHDITCPTYM